MDHARALSARYDAMIATMGLDPADHPLRMVPDHHGGIHVVPLADGGWLAQVTERGQTLDQRTFADSDALLYHLARSIVAREGAQHQAGKPPGPHDPRRADFAHRLHLMGRVSPEWRSRLADELAQVLSRHPYADRAPGPAAPQQRGKGWLGLLVIAVLVVVWAAAHVPLGLAWQDQARLTRAGLPARAAVTNRHRTDGRFADTYRLEFDYVAAGRSWSGSDEVDWHTWRAADYDGARVDILYDTANPGSAMVAGNDRAGRLTWIYAGIDGMLVFVILRGLWRSRRRTG